MCLQTFQVSRSYQVKKNDLQLSIVITTSFRQIYIAKLCNEGIAGLDSLHVNMTEYMGKIIDLVYFHGGDVLTTAGDAIICVFPDDNNLYETAEGISPVENNECALNAFRCACDIKRFSTEELSAHVGVTYGDLSFGILGGHEDRWVYFLNGDPIHELKSCLEDTVRDEMAVSQQFMTILMKFVCMRKMIKTPAGNFKLSAGPTSTDPATDNCKRGIMDSYEGEYLNLYKSFVPKPVTIALAGGFEHSLSELRSVCCVFISLDSYSREINSDPLSLQPFFIMVQDQCSLLGGFVRQFLVDDKGCVLILMWGVPHYSYPNNCSRALVCAISIVALSSKMDHTCSTGITVGTCICGNLGSVLRQDYVVIGSSINLAARLMGKANGRILIDYSVYLLLPTTTTASMYLSEDVVLKGIESKAIYVMPINNTMEVSLLGDTHAKSTILRRALANFLLKAIDGLQAENSKGGISHVRKAVIDVNKDSVRFVENSGREFNTEHSKDMKAIFILGVSGSGLSTACSFFHSNAIRKQYICHRTECTSGCENLPYGIIMKVLCSALGPESMKSPMLRQLMFSLICTKSNSFNRKINTFFQIRYLTFNIFL